MHISKTPVQGFTGMKGKMNDRSASPHLFVINNAALHHKPEIYSEYDMIKYIFSVLVNTSSNKNMKTIFSGTFWWLC